MGDGILLFYNLKRESLLRHKFRGKPCLSGLEGRGTVTRKVGGLDTRLYKDKYLMGRKP